jgi:hypothetical protein
MRHHRLLLVVGLGVLLGGGAVVVRSAPASAFALDISTGSGTGAQDPRWNLVSAPNGVTVGPAAVVAAIPVSWTATIDGSRWISFAADPLANNGPAGAYVFEAPITGVPETDAYVSGTLVATGEMKMELVFGGVVVVTKPAFGGTPDVPTTIDSFGRPMSSGNYRLRVTVTQASQGPVGLRATLAAHDGLGTLPTAVSFHLLPSPVRTYDTRAGTQGPQRSGVDRLEAVGAVLANASGGHQVPPGVRALMVNVTVTDTTGRGYLLVSAPGAAVPSTSTVNWFAAGQSLANMTIVSTDQSGQVLIHAGGAGSCDVVIDVIGYYT